MIRDNFLFLGMLVLIVSMVAISGCTSNTTQNKNFTDTFISFQYPSDFTNTTAPGDLFSSSSNWTQVVYLANSQVTDISVLKLSNSGSFTIESLGSSSAIGGKNQGETLLSSARVTNPNGIQMWKIISTLTDPTLNTERIYYSVFFKQGSAMYNIQVYGDKSKQGDVQKVADTVFNTTTINTG